MDTLEIMETRKRDFAVPADTNAFPPYSSNLIPTYLPAFPPYYLILSLVFKYSYPGSQLYFVLLVEAGVEKVIDPQNGTKMGCEECSNIHWFLLSISLTCAVIFAFGQHSRHPMFNCKLAGAKVKIGCFRLH